MKNVFDLCIVGAGMAGATIASYLGKKGKKIALIDRDFDYKDRIVAELLQPGAVTMLKKMNLGHCLEGIDAQAIFGYGLINKDEMFNISYHDDTTQNHSKENGVGLNSGLFLQNLRKEALQYHNVTAFTGEVTQLNQNEYDEITGVTFWDNETENNYSIQADLTIVSDGFYSKFREKLSQPNKIITSHFIGLVLKDLVLPYPNHGHVLLSGKTPSVCYPIGKNEVRILVDYPSQTPPRRGKQINDYLSQNVLPYLPQQMQKSFQNAINEGKSKVMANHYMPANPILKNGAVLLGDALNMRHPLTGGGLTAVFADIYLLSTHLLALDNLKNQEKVKEKIKLYYKERQHANASVNILANALYEVMSNDLLKTAVFKYIKKGGQNAQMPLQLLAGLERDHKVLIRYFFAVASFGSTQLLSENVTNVGKASKILIDAVNIIRPLAKNELQLSHLLEKPPLKKYIEEVGMEII